MTKRSVILMMAILLLSYAPILGHSPTEDDATAHSLERTAERVEISPDPDSIQDLGAPLISSGFEDLRATRADSSIGVYTQAGLLPAVQLSAELAQPRNDLAIVLIDGEVGLWDARQALLEAGVEDVEVGGYIIASFILPGVLDCTGITYRMKRISIG